MTYVVRPALRQELPEVGGARDPIVLVICTSPRMRVPRGMYERLGFVRLPEHDWMPVADFPLWAYRLDLQRS